MSKQSYKKELVRQARWIYQRCPNVLRMPVLVFLFCGLITLNACKTYYKRGGDGSTLAADQAECQRRTGDAAGEQYRACLRELGWATTGQPLEAKAPTVPAVNEQDAEKNAEAPSEANDPVKPEPKMTTPVTVEVKPAPPLQEATPGTPAAAIPRTPKAVGSWFKLGGTPAQLKTDQADCLTESQHSRQSLSWSADPGFLTCMRARGWHALAE